MEELLQTKILTFMDNSGDKAFIVSDFLELGNHEAVKKALQRLEKEGKIRRILRGVYDRPEYNERFGIYSAPYIGEVAKALARQYNWNICPSGNYALNLLGLSTQVPAKYVYVSDGPYKTYRIGNTEIEFRHSNKRGISDFSYKTLIIIQALKQMGNENITDEIIQKIRSVLTEEDKETLLSEGKKTNIWIFERIKEICG